MLCMEHNDRNIKTSELTRAQETIDNMRQYARGVHEERVPDHMLDKRLNQVQNTLAEISSGSPVFDKVALTATGKDMMHLGASLYDDGDHYGVMFDSEMIPVDPNGIEEIPGRIAQVIPMYGRSEIDGTNRVGVSFLLDPLRSEYVNIGTAPVMARVAIQRMMIFPAHSSGELVVTELRDRNHKESLYTELLRNCPDAQYLARHLKALDKALSNEDPSKFQAMSDLRLIRNVAESASDVMRGFPDKEDSVLSLVSRVIGRGRGVIVTSDKTTLWVNGAFQDAEGAVSGRFVDVITAPESAGKLIAVMDISAGNDGVALAHVPLKDVNEFLF